MSYGYTDKQFRRESMIIVTAGVLAVIDMTLFLIGVVTLMK